MLQLEAMNPHVMDVQFTTHIFKEARSFVAHALELDVSSCGSTKEKALKNFKEAVRFFLEEAEGSPPWTWRKLQLKHDCKFREFTLQKRSVAHIAPGEFTNLKMTETLCR